MSKVKIVGGIELGSSKISTVIAQLQEDPATFEITSNIVGVSSVPSKGIKKGQIVDIEEAVEATISSVEAAERMAGYNLTSAFVSLSGAHVESQNSHGVVAIADPSGEITQGDVERVVEAASAISLPTSRELIHVLPKEYVVDGETGIKDPVGMSGVRLEVETHLVTASQASIKNIRKAINEVGVDIEELVFSGLASSESCLTPTEKELGCVLVDIGGGVTSVAVFIDGSLSFSSVIPVGAKNVTNDLAIGLRISLDSAEKIKQEISREEKKNKKTGSGSDELNLEKLGITETRKVSKKVLREGIIRPRLNEIFTMVKIELERVDLSNRVPSGVVVTGGGSETVGVVDSAKRMLSLPVRLGEPKGLTGLIDDVVNPSFSTSTGLIKYGAQRGAHEQSSSISRKIKLPTTGVAGKFFDIVRDLLP